MDAERLRLLLQSSETGTLEFKREWYKIDGGDTATTERAKGELTKDILSLANGNTLIAGEEAHLIIGASDKLNAEGTRDLFDTAQTNITQQRILNIVNRVCNPSLDEIYCDTITLNETRVVVITIPPTPHLYETTKELKTPHHVYDKYTVFVRHGEGIDIASNKESENILKLKRIALHERRSASPLPFGTAIGAIVGGALASFLTGEKLMASKKFWPISALFGISIGGFFGGVSGYVYSSYYEIRSTWHRTPTKRRAIGIGAASVAAIGSGLVFGLINRRLRKQAIRGTGLGAAIGTWVDSGLLKNAPPKKPS